MAELAFRLPSLTIRHVSDHSPTAMIDDDASFEMRRREPEQPSLFPTEDLIVPDTLRAMKKAVSAIHACPTKADYHQNLNTRRLFDGCILVAQIDCRGRERQLIERIRTDRISPMFEVRISDLARLSAIPGKNYERLYSELDHLYELSLNWNILGEDDQIEWEMKSHFLTALGHGKGLKRGLVRFAFDPSVLEIVLEPSRWATLSLQAMQDLKTASSYALYQCAWRYIGTQNKVTAALPTATWIELLIGKSRYVEEDPVRGKRVKNYGDFKRRVLIDAISRVNEVQALGYTLELKELKSGTRVVKLQFKFIAKQQPSLGLPLTWPEEVLTVLSNMGFEKRDIEDLSQAHSYEEVAEAILRLKKADLRLRSAGQAITTKRRYFEGILRNIAGGTAAEDIDDKKIAEEIRQQDAVKAAEARQERLKEAFTEHQRKRFTEWLFGLEEKLRLDLVAAYRSSGEMTPPIKKFFDNELSPGNLSAQSVLRLWMAKHRPDLMEMAFPNPEDKNLENWMAWKLDGGGSI